MLPVMIALAVIATPDVSDTDRWELKEKAGEYYVETYQPKSDPVDDNNSSVSVSASNDSVKVEAKW